jgi:uncharacterized protein YgiM (DUF1202 family)
MTNLHGMARFAFVLLAAVALAHGALRVAAAHPMSMEAVATPNHEPHHVRLMSSAVAATPGATLVAAADPMRTRARGVATPNHDAHRVCLMTPDMASAEMVAWEPEILRAEPEAAAPAFAVADTMLYAKANARLRAGPSTAAAVVVKLAADAPLRAIARSTDGAWWQVSLADERTGYVRRDAVTKIRVAKAKPPAATAAVASVAAQPAPEPVRRSQGLFGFADEAMNWLTDVAGRGSPPKIIRTER